MIEKENIRIALEKQLRAANGPWERLPILIALTRQLNEPDFSYRCAVEALNTAKELGDPFWIACSLRAMGMRLLRTARYSEPLTYLKEASRIFHRINDLRMKVQTDIPIVRVYIFMGKLDEALSLLMESLPAVETVGDPSTRIRALRYFGDIYKGTGDYHRGLHYYKRALALAMKADLRSEVGYLYQDVSSIYQQIRNTKLQRAYLFKALSAHLSVGRKEGIANATGNIANVYLEQDLFVEAEPYVRRSLKLYHDLGMTANVASALGKLGMIYNHKGDFDSASRCLKKGLKLVRTTENRVLLAALHKRLAVVYFDNGDPTLALKHMRKALAVITETTSAQDLYDTHNILADMYEALGDTANALKHHREYIRIKEAHLNSLKILEVGRAETRARLRTTRKLLKREQTANQDLRKQISDKEEEIVSLTLNLLGNGEATRNGESTNSMTVVNEKKRAAEKWGIFARQFHRVHHDFHFNLLKSHPNLTPTEIKVCSLIRIGLATKEIADILCISKRTIDTHRVRIHKKLNLPRGASLTGFIAKMGSG